MSLNPPSILIDAPHLFVGAKLEVDVLWQGGETLAILCHPNPVDGGTMHNKVVSTLYRFCRDVKGHDTGMNVLRFNSRGVGRSDGVAMAGLAEFDDVRCVLEWALNEYHAKYTKRIKKLWLGGFSFGGFLACQLADWVLEQGLLDIDAVALIAPSIERHDTTALKLPCERTFMIYADNDRLVTPAVMSEFVQRHGIAYTVLAGAGHFFHGRLGELTQSIAAHYQKIVEQAPSI
ncbi:MAG: alpha/beta hydrolase fold domain-containing protein [Moraxella sp.]|nr:alpha/beta hydrolase fold domain-containing protein [Moraxella sp.]